MSNVKQYDSQSLKAGLHGEKPLLLDLYAPWCGPCNALAPTLENLSDQYSEQLTIAKVNIDDFPEVAAEYGVQSIPTLIFFKDGQETTRLTGAQPPHLLEQAIQGQV